MRLLSGSRRTTISEASREAPQVARTAAVAHVEVRDATAIEREPDDLGSRIARLATRAGSFTEGLAELRAPLRDEEVDAIAFVRALSSHVATRRAELAAASAAELAPAQPSLESPRPKELLKAIGAGARSTREIAEAVGITAATALRALRTLEEEGGVESTTGPGRSRQWIVTKSKKKKQKK